MTKNDIINKVTEEFPYMSKQKASQIINLIIDTIKFAIENDERAEFRGFGTFQQRVRRPYKTKAADKAQEIYVNKRVLPYFRASPYLNDAINGRIKLHSDCDICKDYL